MIQPASSRHIIVIDDQVEIHADFQKILAPGSARASEGLARLRAAVKGPAAAANPIQALPGYSIECARQGEEGFKKIVAARNAGTPFSIAYVDMRMPPGWDGFQTMKAIWDADPEIQLVICTAFSDHPWSEIDAFADKSDRVLVLKKPFDPVEVKRMTSTLSAKWRLAREAAAKRAELEEIISQHQLIAGVGHQREINRIEELEALVQDLSGDAQQISRTAAPSARAPGNAAPSPARYSLDAAPCWKEGDTP
jgi:CheY-like chemotaxis protein